MKNRKPIQSDNIEELKIYWDKNISDSETSLKWKMVKLADYMVESKDPLVRLAAAPVVLLTLAIIHASEIFDLTKW